MNRNRDMIRLEVLGEIQYRDVALRTVSSACRLTLPPGHPAREPSTFQAHLVSAVGEAFNNIALHGYRRRLPGLIEIEISFDDGWLTVEVRDTGESFDPRTVSPPDLDAIPESGLGIFIMRSCVDAVDYRAGRPNVLKLVKRVL